MEALKRKWNSSRGASILMALLFLLVCMMVGASVVMAAASNAGKIKSNKEEQQKYLIASSAMTMLVDELESVEYVGKYDYEENPTQKPALDADESPLYDDDGNLIMIDYIEHIYTQQTGALRKRENPDADTTWLVSGDDDKPILPFANDLDWIFDHNFGVPDEQKNSLDEYNCYSLSDQNAHPEDFGSVEAPTTPEDSYTLTFTASAGDDDDTDYGGFVDTVTVKVELRDDGSIFLTATLDGADFTMKALLRPDPDQYPARRLTLPASASEGDNETDPIRWKLQYIFKEEAVATTPELEPTPP